MNKTIIIPVPRRAVGSQRDRLGDETLFYTSDVSDAAREVSSIFLDNPPRLSRAHASLVWRYNRPSDRYLLIHVQGSYVVSEAMGRNYPYRAGFEVARADMNRIAFDVRAFVGAVPRIASLPKGRIDLEIPVALHDKQPADASARMLSLHIQQALVRGHRLLIEVDPPGDTWREDGVFDCQPMQTLLAAIDDMPLQLRRYATFAFCVDENFKPVLDGVVMVCYRKGSLMQALPGDISMTWAEATSLQAEPYQQAGTACRLPGADEPLATLEEVAQTCLIYDKRYQSLQGDEWLTWLASGHELNEVRPDGWQVFATLWKAMPTTVRPKFASVWRKTSTGWELTGLTQTVFQAMHYTSDELTLLQRKALPHLVDGRYAFVFAGGMTQEAVQGLDVRLIGNVLGLGSKLEDIGAWHNVYKTHGRDRAAGVPQALTELVAPHLAGLKTLDEVVSTMRRFPFVPANRFVKPASIAAVPELQGLTQEHRQLVEKWISEAVDAFEFRNIDELIRTLNATGDTSDVAQKKVTRLTEHQIGQLLNPVSKDRALDVCERLLECTDEREDALKSAANHAVDQYLMGDKGKWNDQHLLSVDNWDDLAGPDIERRWPHVAKRLQRHMQKLLESNLVDTMAAADDVERLYLPHDGSDRAQCEINKFVAMFIEILQHKDNKVETAMGRELEKKLKRYRHPHPVWHLALVAVAGLVLGGVLGFVAHKWMNPTPAPGGEVANTVKIVQLMHDDGRNPMLTLSQLSGDTLMTDSLSLAIDSSLMCNNQALLELNKRSLTTKTINAQLRVTPLAMIGTDLFDLSGEMSLLNYLSTYVCRVDTVIVGDGKKQNTIAIPNDSIVGGRELLVNQALPAWYYFGVIRYVEQHLPDKQKNVFPY